MPLRVETISASVWEDSLWQLGRGMTTYRRLPLQSAAHSRPDPWGLTQLVLRRNLEKGASTCRGLGSERLLVPGVTFKAHWHFGISLNQMGKEAWWGFTQVPQVPGELVPSPTHGSGLVLLSPSMELSNCSK